MQLFLKILSEMANSVDPDQTAPEQSDLGLHCLHMSFCHKLKCSIFYGIYCKPAIFHTKINLLFYIVSDKAITGEHVEQFLILAQNSSWVLTEACGHSLELSQ